VSMKREGREAKERSPSGERNWRGLLRKLRAMRRTCPKRTSYRYAWEPPKRKRAACLVSLRTIKISAKSAPRLKILRVSTRSESRMGRLETAINSWYCGGVDIC